MRDEAERLINFTGDGKIAWAVGVPTHQRRRVRRFIDMAAEGARLLVVDDVRHALVFFDRSGQVTDSLMAPSGRHLDRVAPLGHDRYALVDAGSEHPFAILSREQTADTSLVVPWPGFYLLKDMQRQVGIAAGENGRWALFFLLGNGWFAFDGTVPLAVRGRYVDHREFPELLVRRRGDRVQTTFKSFAPCTGCDAMLARDTLWVLAGGSNATKRERLDAFDVGSGKYLVSLRLPGPVRAFTFMHDTLIVAPDDPTARAIVAFRVGTPGRRLSAR